jgi:hypothetical protein
MNYGEMMIKSSIRTFVLLFLNKGILDKSSIKLLASFIGLSRARQVEIQDSLVVQPAIREGVGRGEDHHDGRIRYNVQREVFEQVQLQSRGDESA